MKPFSILLRSALCAATLSGTAATHAATTYKVTDLGGNLAGYGARSAGFDINNAGQVTGSVPTAVGSVFRQPFVYSDGVLTYLQPVERELGGGFSGGGLFDGGRAINDAGSVAGTASNGNESRGVLYQNSVVTNLGVLGINRPPSHVPARSVASSSARDINNAGQITGRTTVGGGYHAFVYSDGVMTDLNTVLDPVSGSGWSLGEGRAINDHGQIVAGGLNGGTVLLTPEPGASTYTLTAVGTLGGSDSTGYGINEAGQVTGSADTVGDAATHAFLYSDGVMMDLGTLEGTFSVGNDINEAGTVVGTYGAEDDSLSLRAFVYSGGLMTDLNTFLDPDTGSGWTLYEATGINDYGQIVANGVNDKCGCYSTAVLLTPVPEPSTYVLMLAGLSALVVAGRQRGGKKICRSAACNADAGRLA